MAESPAARRTCSKQTCNRDAVCTLTYVYSDSTAVIGALSARREPHAYDLCPVHADALTAPRGWRVVRLESPDGWNRDDLDAVVQAVRADEEPAVRRTPRGPSLAAARPSNPAGQGSRVLRDVSYRPRTPEAEGTAADDPAIDAVDGAGPTSPRDVSEAGSGGYSGSTRPIANANERASSTGRPAPLPAALRTPHLRRP